MPFQRLGTEGIIVTLQVTESILSHVSLSLECSRPYSQDDYMALEMLATYCHYCDFFRCLLASHYELVLTCKPIFAYMKTHPRLMSKSAVHCILQHRNRVRAGLSSN